ncbi:MAG: DUF4124 domain-containing protein [Steroidobacteraceae bacterium]
MRAAALRILVPALLAACAAGGAAAQANRNAPKTITYRWVDEQGVVHYGDQVPPQYAGKDREVLNGAGVPVQHFDAQKSPEQVAADARDRAAVIRQKQHDAFLVTTYTSVKDIEALRDSRLEQLKGQRGAAQQYVESLRSRLGALQTRALSFRPYNSRADARRMPDDLAEDLVRTLNEMRSQTNALATESDQEAKLRAQFQEDIERYRELHTLHSTE